MIVLIMMIMMIGDVSLFLTLCSHKLDGSAPDNWASGDRNLVRKRL